MGRLPKQSQRIESACREMRAWAGQSPAHSHTCFQLKGPFQCHKSTVEPALVRQGSECSKRTKRGGGRGRRNRVGLWSYGISRVTESVKLTLVPLAWAASPTTRPLWAIKSLSLLLSSAGRPLIMCPGATSKRLMSHFNPLWVTLEEQMSSCVPTRDERLEKFRRTLKMTNRARLKQEMVLLMDSRLTCSRQDDKNFTDWLTLKLDIHYRNWRTDLMSLFFFFFPRWKYSTVEDNSFWKSFKMSVLSISESQ